MASGPPAGSKGGAGGAKGGAQGGKNQGGKDQGGNKKHKEALEDIGGGVDKIQEILDDINKLQSAGSKAGGSGAGGGGNEDKTAKGMTDLIKKLKKAVDELEKSSKGLGS